MEGVRSLQFWTDEDGVHHSRYGSTGTFKTISPRRSTHNGDPQLPGINTFFDPSRDEFGYDAQMAAQDRARGQFGYERHGYQLPPIPSTSRYAHPSALNTPLPADSDSDFPPPNILVKTIAHPASKTAGSRRPGRTATGDVKGKGRAVSPEPKGKGKRKAVGSQPGPSNTKKQKGRAAGAPNYSQDDIYSLLHILRDDLPLGGKGWNAIGVTYCTEAEAEGRPARTAKSLELKYKQLVKTKKPTGDAEVPDYIELAWEIEDLMNEKAGTRDIDDEDLVDDVIDVSDGEDGEDEDDATPAPLPKRKAEVKSEASATRPVVRRAPTNAFTTGAARGPRSRGAESLLTNLTSALDPNVQAARAEERSARGMQATQILSLSSQLREAQNLIENFRFQLSDAERRCAAAERRADKYEMMAMIQGPQPRYQASLREPRTPARSVRQDIHYPDGGHSVQWVHPDDTPPARSFTPGTRVLGPQASLFNVTGSPGPSRTASSSSIIPPPSSSSASRSGGSFVVTLTPSRRQDPQPSFYTAGDLEE